MGDGLQVGERVRWVLLVVEGLLESLLGLLELLWGCLDVLGLFQDLVRVLEYFVQLVIELFGSFVFLCFV